MYLVTHRSSDKKKAQRIAHYCAYLFSFLCLLRSDEILTLQASKVNMEKFNKTKVLIHLDARKTNQDGRKATSFVLYENKKHPFLCPVKALMDYYALLWIAADNDFTKVHGGFFMKPIDVNGKISFNEPLV